MKPIIKHNKLIEASYKLNSREQFFILYLISQISQQDVAFKEYSLHYSEIEHILNFDGKRRIANKNEVFKLMDTLNSVPIMYEHGTVVGKSVWFQYLELDRETDIFTFCISEKLHEYLLQLREHFTKYNIRNIIYLSANTIRLYETLKRHQYREECVLPVNALKFYLGIEEQYDKYYDFKRYVLEAAQKEIRKYTDISFDFTPAEKDGKRIISLKFNIYENEPSFRFPDSISLLSEGVEFENKSIIKRIKELTRPQLIAYQLLIQKGIDEEFILHEVLPNPKVAYQPLQGCEDIYVKKIWKYFNEKSQAQNRSQAFIAWWRKGYLTDDQVHAKILEDVVAAYHALSPDEQQMRQLSKKMTATAFETYRQQHNSSAELYLFPKI